MNILHYTLGLPPYRSGGLTKYATDLMQSQSESGDTVTLLYPGDYTFWRLPKIKIVKNEVSNNIYIYEIKNPAPVPLLHGVGNPNDILNGQNELSEIDLNQFYNETVPDVFHIHTLMGLPLNLLEFLKTKGVKVVYTSHDYYGLCLKVNFINKEGLFCTTPGGNECANCNTDAPKSLFIRLRNSKYFLKYKSMLSRFAKHKEVKKTKVSSIFVPQSKVNSYSSLIELYHKYFVLIDCFHFNSTVSKEVFQQYITPKQFVVLPISHTGISDNREIKIIDSKHIRLGFIGSKATYKGFPLLKSVLNKLDNSGISNWSLQVWGNEIGVDLDNDKIQHKGKFSSENIKNVFSEIDLLIVPSVWKETFSLITLEALSYGVPVLVSSNVGAKDIVSDYYSDFVFFPSEENLNFTLQNILSNPNLLEEYNKKIYSNKFDYSLEDHLLKIKELYINLNSI